MQPFSVHAPLTGLDCRRAPAPYARTVRPRRAANRAVQPAGARAVLRGGGAPRRPARRGAGGGPRAAPARRRALVARAARGRHSRAAGRARAGAAPRGRGPPGPAGKERAAEGAVDSRAAMPTLFVVSDLHLGETGLARMFHDQAQGMRFADLCSLVARTPDSELVLLGDIFDVTASLPPKHGLAAFGRALEVPLEDRPARPLADICASIRHNNPVALDALEALCGEAAVTLVTGNHDRHLATPEGRAALEFAGLPGMGVDTMAVRRTGERVVVLQHGHGWDPSNATPTGGGEVMTSVIHHAVVPFLRQQRPRNNVAIDPDRVIALRPEERVVPVLERWLKAGMFERFIDAFIAILVENGYMSRAVSWLATAERIRGRLKDDDALWERAGHAALGALTGSRRLPGKPPPPDILVLGHTHVIDWAVHEGRPGVQRLYVNLGTWAARTSDAAGPVEAILPVFRLDAPDRGKVIATLRDLSNQARLLQRFEVRA